ncbi:MAG: secondary thiamine-phosphate synthase enzyme YjbQ [Acidobacteriota bacterium]
MPSPRPAEVGDLKVETTQLQFSTQGFCDVVDLTDKVDRALADSGMMHGVVTLFVPGATAGLTTLEYEPGCVQDLKEAFERLAPKDGPYAHNQRWGDGNGFSHIRAALLGPSFQVPFAGGKLLLGTWQHLVLVDFDNRSRQREVVLQFLGR